MTTYTVSYSDERGNRAEHTHTEWEGAALQFLTMTNGSEYAGFPHPDGWDLIGYLTETVAQYGYVVPMPYSDEVGHSTVAIAYERET